MVCILLYFVVAGTVWSLSICKVSGQVTSHPDGRQNKSVIWTFPNMSIMDEMALNNTEACCFHLDSVEVHAFNNSTNMSVHVRLATCHTFGDWPTQSPGVVNKESRRKFHLKHIFFECSVQKSFNTSSHPDQFVVHSELNVTVDEKAMQLHVPFDELIFITICSDVHGSKNRYPAVYSIDTRENTTESLRTTPILNSNGLHGTDYPSTAGPVSPSLNSLPISSISSPEKVENVPDEKKKTERRLAWYFGLLAMILVSLFSWLVIVIVSTSGYWQQKWCANYM